MLQCFEYYWSKNLLFAPLSLGILFKRNQFLVNILVAIEAKRQFLSSLASLKQLSLNVLRTIIQDWSKLLNSDGPELYFIFKNFFHLSYLLILKLFLEATLLFAVRISLFFHNLFINVIFFNLSCKAVYLIHDYLSLNPLFSKFPIDLFKK